MVTSDNPFELVVTHERLAQVAESLLREASVALDTEANGYYRYPERVCLVQLATLAHTYVLDPIAIGDMSPLAPFLSASTIQKVIHGADYDIRGIDRDWSFRIANIFDTSIAAKFAGMERIGLADTLEESLGLTLEKPKRLQRADWGKRPLSDEALSYAANDVKHMLPLRDSIFDRLQQLDREEWVAEEFRRLEQIRYRPPQGPETGYLLIRGSRTLDGNKRAVLKQLTITREAEALRRGVPPFRVARNEDLIAMARGEDEEIIAKLLRQLRPTFSDRMRHAITKGRTAPPEPRQPHGGPSDHRMTSAQQSRLKNLKTWRNANAKDLALDTSVIWPSSSLSRLARDPDRIGEEFASPEVRSWQVQRFSDSLTKVLTTLGDS